MFTEKKILNTKNIVITHESDIVHHYVVSPTINCLLLI